MIHRAFINPVLLFFLLVFGISVPFWVLGTLTGGMLMPGLPVSALMVVTPAVVGAFLVARDGGTPALRSFLVQALDGHKMRRWAWIVAMGTMPGVMLASAAALILTGQELPPPEFTLTQTLLLFLIFFVAATAEELGWTGFATRRLLATQSILVTGLIVGVVAVAWHILPLVQAERAWSWIAWWAIGTTARRIIIVWLFARGGQSVFGAALFHAMGNVSWMLFPVMGSHYDPMSTALILVMLAAVVLLWDRQGAPQGQGNT